MDRARLRDLSDDLLDDAKDLRERIALEQPSRLASAQMVFNDTFRVYRLVHSAGHLTQRKRIEIVSLLARATLLSEALNVPAC